MRLRLPGRPRRALLRTRVLAGVLLVTLVVLAAFDVAGVTALRRAVGNLLANVSAHTPAGTAATIVAEESDGTVAVEVSDDGPGVPAAQLPRIFDRFYRASAPSARPGSGLGLAIVAAIAAAHGGTAEARLNDPHGLRITLTLPAASPTAVDLAS
jgi:two-component system, OmpR family, sensor kinase